MSRRLLLLVCVWAGGCSTSRLPDPNQVVLDRLDTDHSGRLEATELGQDSANILHVADTDHSGDLDLDEVEAHLSNVPHSPLRMRAAQRGKVRRHKPVPTHQEAAGLPAPEGPPPGGPPPGGPPPGGPPPSIPPPGE
jgi:hypothetical protein